MKEFIIIINFSLATNYHLDMDLFETSRTSIPHAQKDVHEEISYFIW